MQSWQGQGEQVSPAFLSLLSRDQLWCVSLTFVWWLRCDNSVPQCQRCIRAGRTCPGYRNDKEVAFRGMTLFTEKKVEARVQSLPKARARTVQGIQDTSHLWIGEMTPSRAFLETMFRIRTLCYTRRRYCKQFIPAPIQDLASQRLL
jgi:hypothetical protein